MPSEQRKEVLRIGAEPVILWSEEADGSPRWSMACPGWRFRFGLRGEMLSLFECGEGSLIASTPMDEHGMTLVPSDEIPDLEHGYVRIAGFTITEIREIRASAKATGWVSRRAWLTWHLTRLRWVIKGRLAGRDWEMRF